MWITYLSKEIRQRCEIETEHMAKSHTCQIVQRAEFKGQYSYIVYIIIPDITTKPTYNKSAFQLMTHLTLASRKLNV